MNIDVASLYALSLAFLILFIWYLATTLDRTRRNVGTSLIGTAFAICALSLFYPQSKGTAVHETGWGLPFPINIEKGIDLQGGAQFTVEIQRNEGQAQVSNAAVERAIGVLQGRIDPEGTKGAILQAEGNGRILIQVPGVTQESISEIRQLIEQVANLELRAVPYEHAQYLMMQESGEGFVPARYEVLNMLGDGEEAAERKIVVERKPVARPIDGKLVELTGKVVNRAWQGFDPQSGSPVVHVQLTGEGGNVFGQYTSELMQKSSEFGKGRIAIVLDGVVYSAPQVNAILYENFYVEGGSMTVESAQQLSSVLENPLENPVKIVDERSIDPLLGAQSIKQGFFACMIGLSAVVVFMGFYYRMPGVFSIGSVLMNLFILLGLLAEFDAVLTLPGIAGIILTVGMSVDANVLIFERIREELAQGKPVVPSVRAGFDKAFSSIFDANVTTLIAAVILMWQGSGPIKGFAIVLTLGILSSLFTALIVTRNCFDWYLGEFNAKQETDKKISMMRLLSQTSIDFMKLRYFSFVISFLLICGVAATFSTKGESVLGIDFRGGDLLNLTFSERVDEEEVRKAVAELNPSVQYQRSLGAGDEFLTIRTYSGKGEEVEQMLVAKFPEAGFKRLQLTQVAATIGEEFKQRAVFATIVGLIAIFVYITIRFEWSFALGAIVALIHDVAITLGVFALFGYEFSLTTVGAVLTIAGYSINDTIVVFDRIREGLKLGDKGSMHEIINRCVNATLSRTLLTSVTTLIAVIALYVFGGLVINDFAFMLLVGIMVGTYSSVFIASPVVLLCSKGGTQLREQVGKMEEATSV